MAKSKELKQFGREFLLTFTAELIRQHGGGDFFKLKQILKEEKPKTKLEEYKEKKKTGKKAKEEESWEEYEKSNEPEKKKKEDIKKLLTEKKKKSSPEEIKKRLSKPRRAPKRGPKPVLRIPETRLPKQFQYLRPQAKERAIELGKLEDLINDPNVKEVECKGPENNIYVKGNMGYQPTQVTLSESEISDLLSRFSNQSQIPIMAGNYHVAVGDLTLTAQVKEDRGKSTFVIKKISSGGPASGPGGPMPQRPRMPQPPGQAQGKGPQPPAPQPPAKKGEEKEESEKKLKTAGQSQIHDEDGDDFSGYEKSSMK